MASIATTENYPPLIRALISDAACYDHPVDKIELIATHISWLLLTGSYVYKIKKPVNFGFLNFSTLALRERDCLDELRLNRRLAANVYLEVVAISGSLDSPHIKGGGEIIEYAVKMRQFPRDDTLDKLAERGELGALQIDALAARLAHFHQHECEVALADSPWGEPDLIAQPTEENFKTVATRLDDAAESQRIKTLHNWCRNEHAHLSPLMRERKKNGLIRECHGDVHLANLAWVDGKLVIFDCLEFNPALRWIDIISEVAFCYMDLLHRNFAGLAARFLNAWLAATGDYAGMALLRYYAVYRAMVRAKVAVLRAEQGCSTRRAEVTACLQLAEQLSRAVPLYVWITHGLSGSGKTTLSQQLLEKYALIRLRSDVERKRVAGLEALTRSREKDELYTAQASRRTYQHLACLTENLLVAGWPVIVDAAFLDRDQRDLFRDLALRLGVDFKILDIQADPEILRERVMQRQIDGGDASEANLIILNQQLANYNPLDVDELSVTMLPE